MAEKDEIKRVVIGKWMNRSRFIQVEDALEIGKVRFFLGEYQAGQGMRANVYHFMDLDDARVVFEDVAQGRMMAYKEYKGSIGGDGKPVSRVLSVKRDGEGVVYWVEIANGPGKATATGAVMPAGRPTAQVAVGLPVYDARRLAHCVLAYLRAWEAVHLLEMKADESGVGFARGQQGSGFSLNQGAHRLGAG